MKKNSRRHYPNRFIQLKHFASSTYGNVTIMAAFMIVVILGISALAIDYGVWLYQKRELQSTSDSAAMGGSQAIRSGTPWLVTTFATADAATNGFTATGGNTMTVNNPPVSGSLAGNSNAVEVILTKPGQTYLSSLFLANSPTIQARSVSNVTYSSGCVVALGGHGSSSSSSGTLTLNGTSSVNSPGCGVYVNSTSSNAVNLNGVSSLTALSVTSAGGISGSNITTTNGTSTYAPPTDDPYAQLTMPTPGACDYTNFQSNTTQVLNPGTYCSGFSLKANANVTLNPGTYIINGGSFNISALATLIGTGVTIVLTGSSGSYASVTINGGATVNLSAPTSGSLAGILFFGDRSATNVTNAFNGGATNIFNGIIYTPASALMFAGNSSSGGACTQLIANSMVISGVSNFGSGCGSSQVTQVGMSRLSE